jgi:hypothetical protein
MGLFADHRGEDKAIVANQYNHTEHADNLQGI